MGSGKLLIIYCYKITVEIGTNYCEVIGCQTERRLNWICWQPSISYKEQNSLICIQYLVRLRHWKLYSSRHKQGRKLKIIIGHFPIANASLRFDSHFRKRDITHRDCFGPIRNHLKFFDLVILSLKVATSGVS